MVNQNTMRTRQGKQVFYENYFEFAAAVELSKWLEQIKLPN